MLQLFTEAVMKYNCPSRVCADRGQANTLIADYMICQPGPNRSSFICGRSVHNQRIEHLWHDLFVSCTFLYYSLFYHMKETNNLDPDDEVCLFPGYIAAYKSLYPPGTIILFIQPLVNFHHSCR